MIDPAALKARRDPESPTSEQQQPPEPAVAETRCPVCQWGLRVTVTPVEVAP